MKTLEFIKTNGIDALETMLDISIKQTDDLIMLNYNQIKSPKMHEVVKECRSLIIDKDLNIVSRSFDRFFNLGEGETKIDDWNNVTFYDKVDGSLVKVYCYKNNWYVSTKGTLFGESLVGDFNITFKELVYKSIEIETDEQFNDLCDRLLDKNNTYIFEVTSRENRVVKRYDGYKLWYLATRVNKTGEYIQLDYDNLDLFGCNFINEYSFKSKEDCQATIENFDNLEEGFVVYENGVPVAKIKSPLYVAMHRIKGESLTNNRIKEIVLLNEQDEYLTYFPEDEIYFIDYINSYQNMIWHMEIDWIAYNNIIDQKEFALHVKDFAYAPVLFMAKRQGQNAVNVFADMTPNQRMNIFNKFLE